LSPILPAGVSSIQFFAFEILDSRDLASEERVSTGAVGITGPKRVAQILSKGMIVLDRV